jgi:hypothetical protein
MSYSPTLALLRQCSQQLSGWLPNVAGNRALARTIDAYLCRLAGLTPNKRSVEAIARGRTEAISCISVDREEQSIRLHADGVQVRAWLLVSHEELLALEEADADLVAIVGALDHHAREVLRMDRVVGMHTAKIFLGLRMALKRVRGLLEKASFLLTGIPWRDR